MKNEDIASICHETNRALCAALGDMSQPAWAEAPEWQKKSAVAGVEFHLANPDSKPEDSHNSWMKQKLDDGWQFGPTKDPEKKLHPCIMPYSALPREQQVKDSLFIAVVRAIETHLVKPATA